MPVFFPDATKAVIRTLDSKDIENTKTHGVLVNTYHLIKYPGVEVIREFGGVRKFMNWKGAVISDSGGFQVGSLVKKNLPAGRQVPKLGRVTDKGVYFKIHGEKENLLTPESSIRFQMELGVDMVVVLDDFDAPNATAEDAKDSVRRTILWAKRGKEEFERICKYKGLKGRHRPYLLGVIQGGRDKDLRKYCIEELLKIGFDGLGYGGEEKVHGDINLDLAKYITELVPANYFLYALGVGKPEDIVRMAKTGWNIFDCVLPTRDARHKRLYIYNSESISEINLAKKDFYKFYKPDKSVYKSDRSPVSTACDCLLCKNYSRAYLYHLFKEKEMSALRLSTIHNLRFYSMLMENIRQEYNNP